MEEKYNVNGVSLVKIRNRNELRVIALIPEILNTFIDYSPETMDIEDIYALVLNNLPARYVQKGSIVLHEGVSDDIIRQEIRLAIAIVSERPNY